MKTSIIIFFLISSFAQAGQIQLELSEKTKSYLYGLSKDELCKEIKNESFTNPKSICLSYSKEDSCLEWGENINKNTYLTELLRREFIREDCNYHGVSIAKHIEKNKKKIIACEGYPDNNLGLMQCGIDKENDSKDSLRNQYESIINSLSSHEDKSLKGRFIEAHKIWEKFTVSNCQLYANLDPTRYGFFASKCRTHLNNSRAEELKILRTSL